MDTSGPEVSTPLLFLGKYAASSPKVAMELVVKTIIYLNHKPKCVQSLA
jgi:hypothetical protein